MKKNFVKVMFFGALALSTVTYVGCKDYDDDVMNLQEQIDKINAKEPGVSTEAMNSAIQSAVAALKTQLETVISGKADNASVQALQTKVNELVAALNGKADAGKITELVGQINALSQEVNSVNGSLDETKASLEAEIAGLKEQIAKLEEEVDNVGEGEASLREQLNQLTADLAAAQNELNALSQEVNNVNGSLDETKAGLKSEIADLKELIAKLKEEVSNMGEEGETADTSLREQLNQLTAALTTAQNELNALSQEVNNVNGSLGETKADLESEIASLKELIAKLKEEVGNMGEEGETADTSLREQLNQLTADLATAQNKLAEVDKAAKDNAAVIIELTGQIAELTTLKDKLDALEAAHAEFVQTGDLEAYYTKEEIAGIIDTELASYLTDEQVASYVDEIVTTKVMTEIVAINGRMDTFDADLSKISDDFKKYCEGQTLSYNKVIERIQALEDYKENTLTALEETVREQGAGLTQAKTDLAQALIDINDLRDKFAGYATTEALNETVTGAVTDAVTEAKAYVDAEVKKCTDELDILKETLKTLQVDVDGLKNMIQSITFIPNSPLGERIVNFTTLYAKSKAEDDDYEKIPVNGDATQEVMFRISPAAAAKSFADNYEVAFSADRDMTTRAAEDTELFENVGEPVVENGLVTYKIRSKKSGTYSVCMHVSTKEDKVKELGKTDITSDYFVACVSKQYLVDAFYIANADAKVNQELPYDDKNVLAEYADEGRIVLFVSSYSDGRKVSRHELSEFPGIAPKSLIPTFSVVNDTYFKVSGTAVMLKAYDTPSYIDQSTAVKVKVTSNDFYLPGIESSIGTVTVTRTTKKATINYGNIDVTWNNAAQTVEASNFPLNKIYDDGNVRLTLSEFQTLKGTVVKEDDAKVYFVISSTNELTAFVGEQTPAGSYPVQATFTSDGREITVNATITVHNPEIKKLEVNTLFWGGTATAGKVKFTPTLDQEEKPSSITLSYDLSTLFANYSDVKADVAKTAGATLKIDVPNVDNIPGITYSGTTLTFNKSEYTGETTDGKEAKVQIVATVSLDGTTEPLQKLTADVSINNISGSWVAGEKDVTLDNKANTYSLAKGFSWKDMRDKVMWKDGSEVSDEVEFGTKTPLAIYGLTAPTFKFVDAKVNGKETTCPYLTVDPKTGKLSFTAAGKGYNFQNSYTAYVMIVAKSQWGEITGYNDDVITVTIPANVK